MPLSRANVSRPAGFSMITTGFFQRIKAAFFSEPKLHPVDHQLAKRWTKQRLIAVFPELRNNPAALEQAYRDLGLEPRPGDEEGDAETVFVLRAPDQR